MLEADSGSAAFKVLCQECSSEQKQWTSKSFWCAWRISKFWLRPLYPAPDHRIAPYHRSTRHLLWPRLGAREQNLAHPVTKGFLGALFRAVQGSGFGKGRELDLTEFRAALGTVAGSIFFVGAIANMMSGAEKDSAATSPHQPHHPAAPGQNRARAK
eukprot:1387533-Rhodomonas_salina.4